MHVLTAGSSGWHVASYAAAGRQSETCGHTVKPAAIIPVCIRTYIDIIRTYIAAYVYIYLRTYICVPSISIPKRDTYAEGCAKRSHTIVQAVHLEL